MVLKGIDSNKSLKAKNNKTKKAIKQLAQVARGPTSISEGWRFEPCEGQLFLQHKRQLPENQT